ncbi:nucleoside phosphatase family-domain-containing protein [Haematococcus lacustris]
MRRAVLVAYGVVLLTVLLTMLSLFPPEPVLSWPEHREYSVIFDAGSSGTRVHVFNYAHGGTSSYPVVHLPDDQKKTSPGLSTLALDDIALVKSIEPLLKFAKDKVPSTHWSKTPVHLLATAGLRMLPKSQSKEVLKTVRKTFSESGFLFEDEWASILPGELEGLYAWAAFNFAAGTLQALPSASGLPGVRLSAGAAAYGPPDGSTWGVVELGGASLQITFLPEAGAVVPGKARHLPLPGLGETMPLYTHSFLGYGATVAAMRVAGFVQTQEDKRDPCLPRGYQTEAGITGSGSFLGCRRLAKRLLPKSACKHAICSINGEYMPRLAGVFLGTENMFYTAQRLGLPVGMTAGLPGAAPEPSGTGKHPVRLRHLMLGSNSSRVQAVKEWAQSAPVPLSLKQFAAAATRFCNMSWQEVKRELIEAQGIAPKYAMKVCFNAAYTSVLLRDAFHVSESDERVVFSNEVKTAPNGQPQEVNWVLGALLLKVLNVTEHRHTTVSQSALPLNLSLLIIGSAVCVMAIALICLRCNIAWSFSPFSEGAAEVQLPEGDMAASHTESDIQITVHGKPVTRTSS